MADTSIFWNPTFTAFVGAFSAFALVAANDYRRRRIKARQIDYLVADNQALARNKLASVEDRIGKLQNNIMTDSPMMRFHTAVIVAYQAEVIDLLDGNKNQALAALLFWMNAIDGLLDEVQVTCSTIRELAESNAPNDIRNRLGTRLLTQLEDAKRNLEVFIEFCDFFIDGEHFRILKFQYMGDAS